VIRADTLDDVVEVTEFLAHTGSAGGGHLGAITLSGAFRGLLLDGAERNRLDFRPLAPATTEKLNSVLTVGSLVSNPIDGGFGVLTSADNYMASIAALEADPDIDLVILQETMPREAGSERAERYIQLVDAYAATKATKPILFCSPISHSQTDYSRTLRAKAPHVSFLQEANKALRVIGIAARGQEMERLARTTQGQHPTPTSEQAALIECLRGRATNKPTALNEVESKEVLRACGIPTPPE
jgi:acyl-CoA synthetase (NDP forming)